MILKELLGGIEFKASENLPDSDITSVTCDSRKVDDKSVFVCVKGEKADGHKYARQAVEKGAVAIITDIDLGIDKQVIVKNTRSAYAVMCANLNGNPSKKLKLLAVTGTNAKTTITYLLKHILEHNNKKTGLIGTIQNVIGDISFPAKHTTPDPAELHVLFSRMVEAKCEYVVMEASSHALDQSRIEGCVFESAIFTNLTQDHLDYHITMENYYNAKKKLFSMCRNAVINLDDDYGKRLYSEIDVPVITFGTQAGDLTATDIKLSSSMCEFDAVYKSKKLKCHFAMPGRFSVSNALAAMACVMSIGFTFEEAVEGINTCPGVKGRTETIPIDADFTVIRDYAHAPDSLEKIISTVREFAKGKVITLFGCAGNRDRTKRPIMGEIASRLSDLVVLTMDNPRDEDEDRITQETLKGMSEYNTPYKVIPDRYMAIKWALEQCQKDDVLILAGKGHEDYQVLDYGTIYFDEKVIVQELVKRMNDKK